MTRVAIVGGGIGGLATALFLSRRGHRVTLFERDGHRPGRDLDTDFFGWHRPGVPQAVQPHGLLAPVRTVLRAEAPDTYRAMLRMGAREHNEFDWFAERPPARPGDEDLVTVQTRRIVLEAALHEAVHREPGVDARLGEAAEGLVVDRRGDIIPRVTGLRCASQAHPADLVVDAGGRRSPVPGWLLNEGCREAPVENHRVPIAYFCRWYRLRPEGPRDPGRIRPGSFSAFAVGGVFPSDNGIFAASLTVSTADPTRAALRNPAVFERVARTFPAIAAWLDLEPEPVSGVLAMGGLHNRWAAPADADGPVVTGLVGVGDSLAYTNPTAGQGVAMALRAGQWVAHHAGTASDPASFAVAYQRWAARTLRPWFDAQVAADRANAARLGEPARVSTEPPTAAGRERAALAACAFDDPLVMRARAKVRHLVLTADQAYGTEEVRARLAHWLDEHPDFTPAFDGPARAEWESATRSADHTARTPTTEA
ncbi:NAD(P)/FAD-dependent oxidoreductase [Streptomyces gelaticus]